MENLERKRQRDREAQRRYRERMSPEQAAARREREAAHNSAKHARGLLEALR